MTDLPRCRLCKSTPISYNNHRPKNLVYCSNFDCEIEGWRFTEDSWRKLMCVPEKRPIGYPDDPENMFKDIGYNAAIDDMEKGGER